MPEVDQQQQHILQENGVLHNGYHYMTLGGHEPESMRLVDERGCRWELPGGYEVCPNSPDVLQVCAQHSWGAHALVLADGTFCMTKLGPNVNTTFKPGRIMGHDGLSRGKKHYAINYPLDVLVAISWYNSNGKNEIGDGAVGRENDSGNGIEIKVPPRSRKSGVTGWDCGYREIEEWHESRSLGYCPDAAGLISAARGPDGNGTKVVGNFPPLSFDVIVRSRQLVQPRRPQQHGAADPLAAVIAPTHAAGSTVCIRRDDGTDRTLLRVRPTNSRSDDAFVAPKVVISGDDRLQLLQTVSAEGSSFSLVKTSSGVEGYVQSKYIVLAPVINAHNSPPEAFAPAPSSSLGRYAAPGKHVVSAAPQPAASACNPLAAPDPSPLPPHTVPQGLLLRQRSRSRR